MFGNKPVRVKETAMSIAMVFVGLFSLVTSVQTWGIAVCITGILLGIFCLKKNGSSTGAICGTAMCVISLCMCLMFLTTDWMMRNDPAFKASMEQQIEEQFHVELEDKEGTEAGTAGESSGN